MKCFGFSHCVMEGTAEEVDGLSVVLCEEVITYSTHRDTGISFGANIVLRSTTERPNYLGIWHRMNVSPFRLSNHDEWYDPDDLYSHVFFNIAKKRGTLETPDTIEAKLFEEEDIEAQ